jgi:hypothetical protein
MSNFEENSKYVIANLNNFSTTEKLQIIEAHLKIDEQFEAYDKVVNEIKLKHSFGTEGGSFIIKLDREE